MRIGWRLTAVAAFIAALSVQQMIAAPRAHAYDEVGPVYSDECPDCHPSGDDSSPHGGYMTGSDTCSVCHDVHRAPAGISLLKGPTVKDTCETCHDSTGGAGVYGAISARGLQVKGGHSIDTTALTPFGDPVTGEDAVLRYGGLGGTLTCIDCHDPHDSDTVEPFIGDRARSATQSTEATPSSHLLRRRPTPADVEVARYGSDWCAGCHKGRVVGHDIDSNVHPVDTTSTPEYLYYSRVAVLESTSSVTTMIGPLGRTNLGYLMPEPRTPEQTGHAPICQQCHEDARSVGTIGSAAAFAVNSVDGSDPADNPRFQTFPHETVNESLLVETKDDLCLNCHQP
jgi:hypothetical protein